MTVYDVQLLHQGNTYTISVADNQTILERALEEGIELPYSCSAGVCTTCAAQVMEGEVDQGDGMGVSPALQAKGYTLLCCAYPRSNLKIETEKEETVYHLQFGQFQNT